MTQGRQSKRGKIALGLISALLCALAVMPAGALAGGDCEYCVDIPGGDGNGQDPTANASGGSGGGSNDSDVASVDTGTTTTPATDTGATVEPSEDDSDSSGGAAGSGGGKGGDGDKALSGNSGDRRQDSLAPADETTAATQTSDSDDGGFPVILVAIAVLAAAGVGFAAWRVRRGDGMGRPAETGHSA